MKTRTTVRTSLLAAALLLAGAGTHVSPRLGAGAASGGERIRFQITAVEESAAGRNVLSDATVEGPEGTDFTVNLQDARFRMNARFLTDLAPGGTLRLRARLDTRRLYGYSEAGLPLYEEDSQSHALQLGFDEAVVLLPFGGGADARLKIEITPARTGRPAHTPAGELSPPEIKIDRPSPGGAISVEATKVPHDFTVEALLFEDGREVARGAADCLLEEAREVRLRREGASPEVEDVPLDLNFTVERFEPGPGAGRAAVRFDLLRANARGAGAREAFARNWGGVAGLGSELVYDLGRSYEGEPGRKYELRIRVRLAPGEGGGR